MARKKQLPITIETTEGKATIEAPTAEVIPMTPAKPKRSRKKAEALSPETVTKAAATLANVQILENPSITAAPAETKESLRADLDAILTGKPLPDPKPPVVSDLAEIAAKHGGTVVNVIEKTPGPITPATTDSAERALADAFNAAPTLAAKFEAVRHGASVLGREDTTRVLGELEKARGNHDPAPFLLAMRLAVVGLGWDKAPAKTQPAPGSNASAAQAKPKRERAQPALEGGKLTIEKTVSQDGKGAAYVTNFKVPFAAGAKVRIVVEVIS